ncbi:hypothetical protein ACGFJ5_03705 [Micromonospora echinaurantiaca]|uniref:hypothetical protein n=1 Tax=Micromonospora echinaurantiaca TaxID=47857 RepID=UPI003712A8D9
MIFVDIDAMAVPRQWSDKASAATTELIDAADAEARKKILRVRSEIWGEIKDRLAALSAGKCWYCEIKQERSDMAVDHFRPKGRIDGSSTHPGYWWLAFCLDNYRYACTYCNSRRVDDDLGTSGGKQDLFPLFDESKRAGDRSFDLDAEEPLLLDPTKAEDPCLLFFDDEGRVIPHPRLSPEGSPAYLRAMTTIEMLHLNHRGLCERRKRLNRDLRRAFSTALRTYDLYRAGEPAASRAFQDSLAVLARAVSEREELTATAKAFMRGRRGGAGPSDDLLEVLL